VELNIYRKTTYMDSTIHFTSDQSYSHKLAALHHNINRMITKPIMEQAVKQEWKKILIYNG